MIFQHTHAYIWQPSPHTGELKTQTRRIVRQAQVGDRCDGDWLYDAFGTLPVTVWTAKKCAPGTGFRGRGYTKATIRWQVGKSYAVQPGRGQNALYYKRTPHGLSVFDYDSIPKDERPRNLKQYLGDEWLPLRIRITAIRREDVRNISDEDARAEGFDSREAFWNVWVSMHDKRWYETYLYACDMGYLDEYGFYKRPAERYNAWVLTFEVEVQP